MRAQPGQLAQLRKKIILLTVCVSLIKRADPPDPDPEPGWLDTASVNTAISSAYILALTADGPAGFRCLNPSVRYH